MTAKVWKRHLESVHEVTTTFPKITYSTLRNSELSSVHLPTTARQEVTPLKAYRRWSAGSAYFARIELLGVVCTPSISLTTLVLLKSSLLGWLVASAHYISCGWPSVLINPRKLCIKLLKIVIYVSCVCDMWFCKSIELRICYDSICINPNCRVHINA